MGLHSIAVDAGIGGGGAGFLELAIAAECAGRFLASAPLVESAVATTALASFANVEGVEPLLGPVVAGERIATLAVHPVQGDTARLVPAGAVADVVLARRDDQLIAIDVSGTPRDALANLGSMPIADCPVTADAVVLATGSEAHAAHERAVRDWQLLTGAALVGLASQALELGIEYVMQRKAFGILIANFQTIQHRLADNFTAVEGARLLALEAAWARDVGLDNADALATMAFLFASETALKTSGESLHFHGGYGYTLEYDIQLYFRRAKAWSLIGGDLRAGYVALAHRLADGSED
jgi:alkylation response protein AidB-like acyl-CoA dehydrogenase